MSVFFLFYFVLNTAFSSTEVRVGWFDIPHFQNIDKSGNRSGYIYEFLQHIAERAGFSYLYEDGTWQECRDMLADNKVDIVCTICEGEEPAHSSLTSVPLGSMYLMLVARKDDGRFSFDDYRSMNGMTIATVAAPSHLAQFRTLEQQNNFTAKLKLCSTPEDSLSELTHGNADLALIASLTPTTDYTIVAQFGIHNFYIAVSDARSDIKQTLNTAIAQIITETPNYEQNLMESYIDQGSHGAVSFTAAEKKFISHSPIINVYVRADRPVLSYEKNGAFCGLFRYIFNDISKTTGLKFKYIPVSSNKELLEKTSEERNSINGFAANNFKWSEQHEYYMTTAVTDDPLVLVYEKDIDHSIYTVGYPDDEFLPESFIQNAPYTMVPYRTQTAVLDNVLAGNCDAYLTDMYTAQSIVLKHKYQKLIMATTDNMKLGLSFAVSRSSDSELCSLLDKAIRNISKTEKSNFLRKSISDSNHYSFIDFVRDNSIIIILMIALFLALFFIIIMQKRNSRRLAEASKNKDAFLANMSHDFRTPLTAIKGFAYLGKTEQEPKYYDQILSSSDYLLELVKDILNIQAYAQGKTLELSPAAVKSETLVTDILDVVKARADAKNISIKTNSSFGYPYINIDVLRFKQIFINIINNSIKYSAQESTVIWNISSIVENGSVHFVSEVIDHGVGMSEDFVKNKLFTAFEREHNAFSISEGGSGLGLVITKMIVDRMGGSINVKSEVGKGTTIKLDIPIKTLTAEEYEQNARQIKVKSDTFDFSQRHILVCEDNELNIFIISNLLKKRGCIVDTAENGDIGLHKFIDSPQNYYDAILMDIRMPVLDGVSAAAKIRMTNRSDAHTVPIIALSANASDDDINKSEAAGMNAHLSKPIDIDSLFTTLAELISRR